MTVFEGWSLIRGKVFPPMKYVFVNLRSACFRYFQPRVVLLEYMMGIDCKGNDLVDYNEPYIIEYRVMSMMYNTTNIYSLATCLITRHRNGKLRLDEGVKVKSWAG